MRLIIVFFLLCLTFPQAVILGANPVVASIIVQKTEVRSGPDLSFYPTSTLNFGDKVEIYFETDNWCAIRPPLGSFSWVSAGHVSLGSGNIGVVLTTGLASRVGSDLTDSCDTVQVKLKRGEKILVLGKKETPENPVSPIWFKISPPSGEYRWVARAAIYPNFRNENALVQPKNKINTAEYLTNPSKLQDYRLVLHEEPKSESTSTNQITTSSDSSPPLLILPSETETNPPSNNSSPNITASNNVDTNIRNTNNPRINNTEKTVKTINLAANNAAKNVVNNSTNINTNTNAISVTKTAARLRFDNNIDSDDSSNVVVPKINVTGRRNTGNETSKINWNFQRVFEELQSETVAALTGQTDDWVFVTLIEEANRLYDSAETDVEMEKVYHIIESLKRGRAVRQDIATRRQTNKSTANNLSTVAAASKTEPLAYWISSSPSTTTTEITPAASLPDKNITPNKTATALGNVENQFDVSGKLGIFEPLQLKHPPFAVVDSSGRIICLLTPEAGMDLRQYVGKVVGINGIRGVYRKSGQPDSQHITVKTIAIIEKQK